MSIRQYRQRNNRRHGISANQNLSLFLLLILAIAIQISYPLVEGDSLRYVTIFTVATGALLMLAPFISLIWPALLCNFWNCHIPICITS